MKIYIKTKTYEQTKTALSFSKTDAVILEPDQINIVSCHNDNNALKEAEGKIDSLRNLCEKITGETKEIYLSMPYVLREDIAKKIDLKKFFKMLEDLPIDGVLLNDIDSFALYSASDFKKKIIGGEFLYSYNRNSADFYKKYFNDMSFVSPPELTLSELHKISAPGTEFIYKIYGHQILMVTAQDLNKNKHTNAENARFKNEKEDEFISFYDKENGYSLIYNGAPTFMIDKPYEFEGGDLLLDFSLEDQEMAEKILHDLTLMIDSKTGQIKRPEVFTRGHYYKNVE